MSLKSTPGTATIESQFSFLIIVIQSISPHVILASISSVDGIIELVRSTSVQILPRFFLLVVLALSLGKSLHPIGSFNLLEDLLSL
jgi:hypothetical protein